MSDAPIRWGLAALAAVGFSMRAVDEAYEAQRAEHTAWTRSAYSGVTKVRTA